MLLRNMLETGCERLCWWFLHGDNDDVDDDHDHKYDVDDHDYGCTPEPWFSY